ncbi:MAG: ABC transporter ATP-binding protein [Gammaproteobacteria bacterium]|nr:ABC transporter ATP-binding protein [Gammaproteobacteria bacterium]MDE0488733.1 ABC transporter ATP-binding protein [Gammaproteobacteria bacterium]MXZ26810.1 ABC transporter ATP-binding protein [Gammaproteobacteria bacterium]MYF59468.1 ABC transporter ATP-binding protein [Gammaproteobacteria bacterium]MYH32241.1 ABC transporter ATP-binding protein [Gammaproteobacteria bacterium]
MLQAAKLTKSYGDIEALKGLDMTVEGGDIYCLLGANGAGKTTTISLFLNFIRPDGGTATVCGLDVTEQPLETKKLLAYIPEQVMLYGNLTALENLRYFSQLGGHDYSQEEYRDFLRRVGLEEEAVERRVKTYSKGMRQKVGVAIALAKQARALLLDEPTAGLDPKASNEFSELLLNLKSDGAAILMATHDLFRAKETGTRIGIMKEGRLVDELSTGEVSHADVEKIYLQHMHAGGHYAQEGAGSA